MPRTAMRRVLTSIAHPAARLVRALPLGHRGERFLLERAWARVPAEMLDSYLVSGYQNPRINIQSILLRHDLTRRLFGSRFDALMDEELAFAVGLNAELRARARELGVAMGSFVKPARQAEVRRVEATIAGRDSEFEARWRGALETEGAEPIRVLELACGSANDYRAFVAYGLSPFLDYVGIDITARNIENATRRFPGVRFEVGDAVEPAFADESFDMVIASDLFEHLAIPDMERALDRAMRLARRGLVLTFFNMSESQEHLVAERRTYHWNRLSRPQIEARLRTACSSVAVTPIAAWLAERYGAQSYHAPHAYTIVAER